MTENPFESPRLQNSDAAFGNPLMFPAICLCVLSVALLILFSLSAPRTIMSAISTDITTSGGQGRFFGLLSVPIINIAIGIEVLRGSIGMMKFNR